jgi:glucan-binding YG repeat protein
MTETLINGWVYCTDVIPGHVKDQTLQNTYLSEYNLAYHKFVQSLMLNITDDLNFKNEGKYRIMINCDEDNDTIDNNSKYYIKFTRSKFITGKSHKIRQDLFKFYNTNDILVNGPFKINDNLYYIDLLQKNDKLEKVKNKME